MEIKIEKNIPLKGFRGNKQDMSFIDSMQLMDSFAWPMQNRQSMLKRMNNYVKYKGLDFEFTSRQEGTKSANSRIWRIK